MPELPSGTVTFLFTDIEGSTALWERDATAMRAAVERHLALLDEAIAAHGGVHFKTIGDAVQAAFPSALAAVAAAIGAQRALLAEPWGAIGPLRVRMAIHAGEATPRDSEYLGPTLNRLARVLSTAQGGQILLSQTAQALARDRLPAGATLRDLGEHRLRDLLDPERVFQVLHPDLPADFPPLRSLDTQPNNLPRQVNAFFGREREIAQIVTLLREAQIRLLTLTGPGGVGKTRLALQSGAELMNDFPDGVYIVPLATITDPALVPATIAAALGIRETAGETPGEELLATISAKRMLLLLDNLEQLPGASPFIAEVLAAASGVKVLATSRAPLRVRVEREFPVLPLPLPPAESSLAPEEAARFDAIRLFVARAHAVKPDFTLDEANAAAVSEIVRRLDGLPLAIELAAARVRLFSPEAMLTRLQKRLPLLTGGARDLPERQRALRETIGWSYDLLTPDEQFLFRHLALFAGGMTLDAAAAVAAPSGELDAIDGLERLVEHSLVQVQAPVNSVEDGSTLPRFQMLETIREYGLERLAAAGEHAAGSDRHAAFFLALAEEAVPELDGPRQGAWLDRLETEHENLRTALGWATDRPDDTTALRMAAALWPFWHARGHFSEGRSWLERILARDPSAPASALAAVLRGAGSIARMQGDAPRALTLLERALTVWRELGDRRGAARTLIDLGHVADRQGNPAAAAARYEEALAIGREIGDRALVASALGNLGIAADERGDYARATACYEEALALFREQGDRRREAAALDNLGVVARSQGDLDGAARRYEEAIRVSREIGDTWGLAATLGNLGVVAYQRGDLQQARQYYEESLAGFRALGDRCGIANTLGNLGTAAEQEGDLPLAAALHREALEISRDLDDQIGLAIHLEGIAATAALAGELEAAARAFAAAEALRTAIGSSMPPDDLPAHDRAVAVARAALAAERFAAAWEAGRARPITEAANEALGLAGNIAQSRMTAR